MADIPLSTKYKDFLKYNDADCEVLEGTTAAGKTTIGLIKFMFRVAQSPKKTHFIAKDSESEVLSKLVNKEFGISEVFAGMVEIHSGGKKNEKTAHILYHTPNGDKTIYIYGYKEKDRWRKILGGQYGCCYIDEINTADMAFVKQTMMRCDYLMATLNPDDPDKPIYKELINRCRPIEKYKDDAPDEILKYLDEPAHDKWVWWYFDFDDNWGLTEEKKEKIKSAHTPGSIDYKHYILGIRGKAQGVIFDNFSTKTHTITEAELAKMVKAKSNEEHFIQFTAGLDTAYSSKSEDTVAMTFMGITSKRRLIYIDEKVINNKDTKTPFAPSDIVKVFVEFLEKNRERYGFARDVFIDSADQATITEANKYKRKYGCLYNFIPAHKALKIIDRINFQKGWIATGNYLVCNLCKEHIREMQVYSWSDKSNNTTPEDANNHTIDSQCYAWIPYKMKIG